VAPSLYDRFKAAGLEVYARRDVQDGWQLTISDGRGRFSYVTFYDSGASQVQGTCDGLNDRVREVVYGTTAPAPPDTQTDEEAVRDAVASIMAERQLSESDARCWLEREARARRCDLVELARGWL
jgi:hypothetical protein